MKRLLGALVALGMAAGSAQAAPIFTDGFEDGNHTSNPAWQVLTVPDVNTSHANRWTVTSSSPIVGAFSELWDDWQGGAGCAAGQALGDCFPLGILYQEPGIGSRPKEVRSYTITHKAKLENNGTLASHLGLKGYAAGTGVLLWPAESRGAGADVYAGGFSVGLFWEDPNDPASKINAGILYIEAAIRQPITETEICSAIFIEEEADIDPATFFTDVHDIRLTVRNNRFIELTVDGKFYGQADAGSFTTSCDKANTLGLADMDDVLLAGFADNTNRYDSVAYDNAPPADANRDGVPDALGGAPDGDCDGIRDDADPDADGDGIVNVFDPSFDPLVDTDGDGFPDQCDPDADDDGCPNAQDPNLDPTVPECSVAPFECGLTGTFSHDCDGDGVANDCELNCGTDVCDVADFCDTNPPKVSFTEPKRNQVYLKDSMAQPLNNGDPVVASSMTVKASASDAESSVASVSFVVDGEAVPPCVDGAPATCAHPPQGAVHSFRWNIADAESGAHVLEATAVDAFDNEATTRRTVQVVPLSALTDMTATDVTDQYAMVIEPRNGAFGPSDLFAIQPQGGSYRIDYRVVEYPYAIDALGKLVTTCNPSRLYVVSLENGVNGLTTPGAFPGFWHDPDPRFTVTNVEGTCSNGRYTAIIPAEDLAAVADQQPVTFWAYVDVPDRAATGTPETGTVDSASGFFNFAKVGMWQSPASDRLDEAPTPVFIRP